MNREGSFNLPEEYKHFGHFEICLNLYRNHTNMYYFIVFNYVTVIVMLKVSFSCKHFESSYCIKMCNAPTEAQVDFTQLRVVFQI